MLCDLVFLVLCWPLTGASVPLLTLCAFQKKMAASGPSLGFFHLIVIVGFHSKATDGYITTFKKGNVLVGKWSGFG